MRKIWALALVLGLSACASAPAPVVSANCSKDASRERGFDDANEGHPRDGAFLSLCSAEDRDAFRMAYREGYDAGKKRRHEIANPTPVPTHPLLPPPPAMARSLASPEWVCEVEASAKVFTGVGPTKAEADHAAKETCGTHFQASYCGQSECRQQNL